MVVPVGIGRTSLRRASVHDYPLAAKPSRSGILSASAASNGLCPQGPTGMRVSPMTDHTVDLDKHRGMAAQKATDLRRALAEVENNVRELREREADLENRLLTVAAASWPEAAAKARYLLNLYAASLPPEDTRHRALVAALFDDFVRLSGED